MNVIMWMDFELTDYEVYAEYVSLYITRNIPVFLYVSIPVYVCILLIVLHICMFPFYCMYLWNPPHKKEAYTRSICFYPMINGLEFWVSFFLD